MRPRVSLISVCVGAFVAVSVLAQEQAPIRSGANTVAIHATVTDGQGRLVPDLPEDAFEVYDNGKLQRLTVFSNEVQPITVVMMLDRSGSMRPNFRLVEAAGEAFVRRLRPDDKARIGSFAARVQVDPRDFTSDQEEMVRILRSELQDEGPTPLWNAVNVGITSLLNQQGRRVVLVFTDGDDNPMNFKLNNLTLMDVLERAQKENVMVYAIGLEGAAPSRGRGGFGGGGLGGGFGGNGILAQRPDPGLARLAAESGGGYFELTRADHLASAFARVADELHQQYALGFEPASLDNRTHKLEVKVKRPGAQARARKNYFAKRPQ